MDRKQAFTILGISGNTDKTELKKQYRRLMRQVHPDNGEAAVSEYEYSAIDINSAYAYLMKSHGCEDMPSGRKKAAQKENWRAPINARAFASREIYDEVTDANGNTAGVIVIGKDKYYYTFEEEFRLFIKSIYNLSKCLLDDIDCKLNRENCSNYILYQAELSYLLASQYIDAKSIMYRLNLDIESDEKAEIFYVPAMIEGVSTKTVKNTSLYPESLRNHKLYVCDKDKKSYGYISFADDILSFAVIPLLESKCAQVKMSIADNKSCKNDMGKKYSNVNLWIRISGDQTTSYIDNVNLKIADLLNRYQNNSSI